VSNIYELGLDQNPANFSPLTPVSFLERSARVYPDKTAVIYNDVRRSWSETYDRCLRAASALSKRGIGQGDTVSILSTNLPEIYEAHFAVPMAGAVLNAINTRLDASAVAFILNHAETKVFIVDPELCEIADQAVKMTGRDDILVVDIVDQSFEAGRRVGAITFEHLVAEGDLDFECVKPQNEWEAISLNYTSGTTGDPKGVVYHYRGAYLNALANIVTWEMGTKSVYLWTLPMFHCNGWCFPWAMAAVSGTIVCLRAVRDEPILSLMKTEKVTHFCGASVVLVMLANAPDDMKQGLHSGIKVLTGGAPPPATVLKRMEEQGFDVTHGYGLTETYGPSVICAWHDEWGDMTAEDRAAMKARQGVRNLASDGLMVADPETLEPCPADGETMGEIFLRGNNVMKGYLKNPSSTEKAFRDGWFASGDLGVMHPDGYVQLKDRSKDIIISGGENISSVEVEDVIYKHPAILEAAVVAKPDEKWGETPCAFVAIKPGMQVTDKELIEFCREQIARYKVPKTVVFKELPKTSTGKIQKFLLREEARALA